jgi:hypothetical protein
MSFCYLKYIYLVNYIQMYSYFLPKLQIMESEEL